MQINDIIHNSSYHQFDSAFFNWVWGALKNAESHWRYDELCMMSSIWPLVSPLFMASILFLFFWKFLYTCLWPFLKNNGCFSWQDWCVRQFYFHIFSWYMHAVYKMLQICELCQWHQEYCASCTRHKQPPKNIRLAQMLQHMNWRIAAGSQCVVALVRV